MIEFHPAPKTFKKVKTVKLYIVDEKGVKGQREVPVYLSASGTPTFCIAAPAQYELAWSKHRSSEYGDSYGHYQCMRIIEGWIHAATFDDAVKTIEALSENYRKHIESVSIRKIIIIGLELVSPANKIEYDKPSFSHSRTLVGMRSEVLWEVNGKLYRDDRHGMRWNDEREPDIAIEPTYEQMRPTDWRGGKATRIDYTDEAWATVKGIEETLNRAAQMLMKLTKPEDAQILLQNGITALLAPPTKEE